MRESIARGRDVWESKVDTTLSPVRRVGGDGREKEGKQLQQSIGPKEEG